MFDDQEFQRQMRSAIAQLKKTFGGDPKTLRQGLRRGGRLVPRKARRAAQLIMAAQKQAGHPKLSRQLDGAALTKAFETLSAGLSKVDMADRRKGMILGILGSFAFNLLLLFALFLTVAVWRGWV